MASECSGAQMWICIICGIHLCTLKSRLWSPPNELHNTSLKCAAFLKAARFTKTGVVPKDQNKMDHLEIELKLLAEGNALVTFSRWSSNFLAMLERSGYNSLDYNFASASIANGTAWPDGFPTSQGATERRNASGCGLSLREPWNNYQWWNELW
jgi:hypothetical protein